MTAFQHMRDHSRPQRSFPRPDPQASRPARKEPLGSDRFKELMQGASAFFAAAERDEVAERAAAIEEIKALMAEYGLTPADLDD